MSKSGSSYMTRMPLMAHWATIHSNSFLSYRRITLRRSGRLLGGCFFFFLCNSSTRLENLWLLLQNIQCTCTSHCEKIQGTSSPAGPRIKPHHAFLINALVSSESVLLGNAEVKINVFGNLLNMQICNTDYAACVV